MTNLNLDHLEALANAATFGEWWVGNVNELYTEYMDELMGIHPRGRGHFRFHSDAEVAAAAVNALPDLIAEIRRLRAQVERVKADARAEALIAAAAHIKRIYPAGLVIRGDIVADLRMWVERAGRGIKPNGQEYD